MKIPKFPTDAFKKPLKTMEIIALVIFVIFLLFPFQIPSDLAYFVNSIGGILVILIIIILLFVNAHPVVAIVYLLVAYEVIRRSGKSNVTPSGSSSSCKQNKNLKMNPINNTDEINETDKDYVANYNESVPNTMLPYEVNYASIGVNSNDSDREKELARINPPVEIGNSLEEEVIRERIPSNALHANTVAESSDFSPVYDKTAFDVSEI